VLGAIGRAVKFERSPALKDAVDNDLGEVVIVQDSAPGLGGLATCVPYGFSLRPA